MTHTDDAEDFVNARVAGQSAIENAELSLQSLGNVISTTSRMDHGRNKLHVDNICKISRLFQIVKPFNFQQLPDDFIGNL